MTKPSLINFLSRNTNPNFTVDLSAFDLQSRNGAGQNALIHILINYKNDKLFLTPTQWSYLIDNSDLKIEDNFGETAVNYLLQYKNPQKLNIPEKDIIKLLKACDKSRLKKLMFDAIIFEKRNNILSSAVWDYIVKTIDFKKEKNDNDSLLVYFLFYPESCINISPVNWSKIVNKTLNRKNNEEGLKRVLSCLCSEMTQKERIESFSKIWPHFKDKESLVKYLEESNKYTKIKELPEFIAFKEKMEISELLIEKRKDKALRFKI